ncbi:hypothetical protein G7Y89_g13566 [Cudoniella acicularis]|uniref:Uncharacterized protein n=1 Tax=Cudoniella acicularis TaxID=354080 RepID=A0A8H4R706_9HELO|nr:hypothetical protein G7Y89_g13566 [Cudoniella acicularis]
MARQRKKKNGQWAETQFKKQNTDQHLVATQKDEDKDTVASENLNLAKPATGPLEEETLTIEDQHEHGSPQITEEAVTRGPTNVTGLNDPAHDEDTESGEDNDFVDIQITSHSDEKQPPKIGSDGETWISTSIGLCKKIRINGEEWLETKTPSSWTIQRPRIRSHAIKERCSPTKDNGKRPADDEDQDRGPRKVARVESQTPRSTRVRDISPNTDELQL